MLSMQMEPIAHIITDFPTKFGIPRQSGLTPDLTGRIIFEPPYRKEAIVKGLSSFSYIWVLWGFDKKGASATVRPPRLGGKETMGVFATRSPLRPNPIGLSSLRLLSVESGPELIVASPDMVSGTLIYDIKPYIPAYDCHSDASSGYLGAIDQTFLSVRDPGLLLSVLPEEKRQGLIDALKQDPRPACQRDKDDTYGMSFCGYDVRFAVSGTTATITGCIPV